ncbi:MAG: paraquat-inducible protein A [Candidatus Azotimanducaceae bacterium]|jgi:paraquat-inducible protein A
MGLADEQSEEEGLMNLTDCPLVACHECDAVYKRHEIAEHARADCTRCGYALYQNTPNSLNASLALYISAFVLMIIANVYPFLTMKTAGIFAENHVFSGGVALYEFGMAELGIVVFLTSILFPFLAISGMLFLLIPLKFSVLPPAHGIVYRIVRASEPWSLLSVFMLGTLISVVKLKGLATVSPGLGMFGFIGMLLIYSAARLRFDPEVMWIHSSVKQLTSEQITPETKIIACHTCGLIRPFSENLHHCQRCGDSVHYRTKNSLERTGALLVSAALMLIPANLLPVMTIKMLGKGQPDTIISGVLHLFEGGLWGLAMIVLIASIIVPGLKLTAMCFLLYTVRNKSDWRPRDRTLLYRITEVVGAWSMVDVFLVGLLSGLVQLGFLATIEPGPGVVFFGAAVILTMLAAFSFDPRLIWDGAERNLEKKNEIQLSIRAVN